MSCHIDRCTTLEGDEQHSHSALKNCKTRAASTVILTFSSYETRSRVLLDELGWERLEKIRYKQLAMMMYKIYDNLSPSLDLIQILGILQTLSLIQNAKYSVPKV